MSINVASELERDILDFLSQIDTNIVSDFLADWPTRPLKLRKVKNTTFPVLRFLHEISILGSTKITAILQQLQINSDSIFWRQSYKKEDFGSVFLENYAHTELIGTIGPIQSDKIACGFLLLGPNTEYPGHSHESEELYIPFSKALWSKDRGPWEEKLCGSQIYHKEWIRHSMKTTSEPLLALYIWKGGDLLQKPVINK